MKTNKLLKNTSLAVIIAIMIFFATSTEANAGPRVRFVVGFPAPVVFVPVRHRPHYIWIAGQYRYNRFGHRIWYRGYWRHY